MRAARGGRAPYPGAPRRIVQSAKDVIDPQVLAKLWVMTPRTMRLITNPDAGLLRERGNCKVYEEGGRAQA